MGVACHECYRHDTTAETYRSHRPVHGICQQRRVLRNKSSVTHFSPAASVSGPRRSGLEHPPVSLEHDSPPLPIAETELKG